MIDQDCQVRSLVEEAIARHERKQARFGVLLAIAIAVAAGAIGFLLGRC